MEREPSFRERFLSPVKITPKQIAAVTKKMARHLEKQLRAHHEAEGKNPAEIDEQVASQMEDMQNSVPYVRFPGNEQYFIDHEEDLNISLRGYPVVFAMVAMGSGGNLVGGLNPRTGKIIAGDTYSLTPNPLRPAGTGARRTGPRRRQ